MRPEEIQYRAKSFRVEADKSSIAYEVKRTRAIWDDALSIPGTNRRGGWRCPPGTRYGGQITDRFGRNCGWGVARRLANEISDIGERLESIGDRRERRRRERGARVRGPGMIERAAGRVAEALDSESTTIEAPRQRRERRGQARRAPNLRASEQRRMDREIAEPGAPRTDQPRPARRRRNLRPSEERRMEREIAEPGAARTEPGREAPKRPRPAAPRARRSEAREETVKPSAAKPSKSRVNEIERNNVWRGPEGEYRRVRGPRRPRNDAERERDAYFKDWSDERLVKYRLGGVGSAKNEEEYAWAGWELDRRGLEFTPERFLRREDDRRKPTPAAEKPESRDNSQPNWDKLNDIDFADNENALGELQDVLRDVYGDEDWLDKRMSRTRVAAARRAQEQDLRGIQRNEAGQRQITRAQRDLDALMEQQKEQIDEFLLQLNNEPDADERKRIAKELVAKGNDLNIVRARREAITEWLDEVGDEVGDARTQTRTRTNRQAVVDKVDNIDFDQDDAVGRLQDIFREEYGDSPWLSKRDANRVVRDAESSQADAVRRIERNEAGRRQVERLVNAFDEDIANKREAVERLIFDLDEAEDPDDRKRVAQNLVSAANNLRIARARRNAVAEWLDEDDETPEPTQPRGGDILADRFENPNLEDGKLLNNILKVVRDEYGDREWVRPEAYEHHLIVSGVRAEFIRELGSGNRTPSQTYARWVQLLDGRKDQLRVDIEETLRELKRSDITDERRITLHRRLPLYVAQYQGAVAGLREIEEIKENGLISDEVHKRFVERARAAGRDKFIKGQQMRDLVDVEGIDTPENISNLVKRLDEQNIQFEQDAENPALTPVNVAAATPRNINDKKELLRSAQITRRRNMTRLQQAFNGIIKDDEESVREYWAAVEQFARADAAVRQQQAELDKMQKVFDIVDAQRPRPPEGEVAAAAEKRVKDAIKSRKDLLAPYLDKRYGEGNAPWKDMTRERLAELVRISEDRQATQDERDAVNAQIEAWALAMYSHDEIEGKNGQRYRIIATANVWRGEISINAKIYHIQENGELFPIGSSSRTVFPKFGEIYNARLFIDVPEHKNSGIQTIYNQHAWMYAVAAGFEKAMVTAAADGPYVWGRIGFGDPESLARGIPNMQEALDDFRSGIESIIKSPEDAEIVDYLLRKYAANPNSVRHMDFIYAISNNGGTKEDKKAREREIRDWFFDNMPFDSGELVFSENDIVADPRDER